MISPLVQEKFLTAVLERLSKNAASDASMNTALSESRAPATSSKKVWSIRLITLMASCFLLIFLPCTNHAALPEVSAAQSTAFDKTDGPLSLIGMVSFWFDPSNTVTLGNTLSQHQDAFTLWPAKPIALNQKSGTLWLRIPLPSLTAKTAAHWALHFSNHRIETINVFQVHNGTTLASTRLGRLQPAKTSTDPGFGYIVPLQGFDVPTTLMVAITSQTPVMIEPRLVPIESVQRLTLNTLMISAFFPLAILAFWLIFLISKQLSRTSIPPVFWCIGPVFCLHAWVYSPISYYSSVFGTNWLWQKAITLTPIFIGFVLFLGANAWVDKALHAKALKRYASAILTAYCLGIVITLSAAQPMALSLNWSILLLSIAPHLVALKRYANLQDNLMWSRYGMALWIPIAFIELVNTSGLIKMPPMALSLHGLIALLGQTLFVLQIDKKSGETVQRETKKMHRQKRSLTQSLKTLELNLTLKHQFFQKVSEDIHEQLKELEAMKKGGQSPAFHQKSLDHLATLAMDIQRFCEVESGCLKLNTRDFDIKQLIINLVETHSRVAKHKEISFQSTVCSKLPDKLRGDPDVLTQLLAQILDNALKFTNEGSVKLIFKVIENRKKSRNDNGMMVRITIKDTGPGLPESILAQFYGLEDSASDEHTVHHLGVGLTTARQMVALMQGEIHLSSAPGKGTRCEINIPMQTQTANNLSNNEDKKSQQVIAKNNTTQSKTSKRTALLISKTPEQHFIQALASQGYLTTTPSAQDSATDIVSKNSIDMIFIALNDTEVQSTISALRQTPGYTRTPIIGLSSEENTPSFEGLTDIAELPLSHEQLSVKLKLWDIAHLPVAK